MRSPKIHTTKQTETNKKKYFKNNTKTKNKTHFTTNKFTNEAAK